ncbi:MAG: hypothetical protein RLZZ387_5395 [Chloroflexota bacterium]
METRDFPDRYNASIPADDPRFAELRAVLATVRQNGRHSPAARMLGEWALLGFLLTTGRLKIGEGTALVESGPDNLPDPRELLAAREHVEVAVAQLGGFEE